MKIISLKIAAVAILITKTVHYGLSRAVPPGFFVVAASTVAMVFFME